MLINYYEKYEEIVSKMFKGKRLTDDEYRLLYKLEEWLENDDRLGDKDLF